MWSPAQNSPRAFCASLFIYLLIGSTSPQVAVADPNSGSSAVDSASPKPSDTAGTFLPSGLPVTFEPNVGQAAPEVPFLSRSGGIRVSFEPRQILIRVPSRTRSTGTRDDAHFAALVEKQSQIAVSFPGASPHPELVGSDLQSTISNYYLGPDPAEWHTGVANYGKLSYHNLYPGIDAVFHGDRSKLEYDFVVAPGADPRKIKIRIEGSVGPIRLSLGGVEIPTQSEKLRFGSPEIFQIRDGRRERVRGAFVPLGPQTLGLRIGAYDHSLPLVIDPTLSYGTFLSGTQDSTPVGVAANAAGEIYVAGSTMATDFPTAAAFQPNLAGYESAYISKISASGTSLVFSTYIGGSGFDTGAGLAIDSQNNAYLLGNTSSANFPTTHGAFRTACPAQPACSGPFVAKFSPSGLLIFSTLLSVGANGKAIAVDALGNSYITGGMNFPGLDLVNAFEPQYQGAVSTSTGDGFVQELNSSGTALVYSTYLAGVPGTDGIVNTLGTGIAVDSKGSAYVTGNSTPANFPTKNISPTLNAGHGIFVAKFTPDGSNLVFAASISGSGTDTANGIAIDSQKNVYVTGSDGSTDFPVTANAFEPACSPVGSALCQNLQVFALKISADGSSLLYSTLIGTGYPGGIAVDSSGRAYLTGGTGQANFVTVNPIQAVLQSSSQTAEDAYITALDAGGSPFFSTFLGAASTPDYGSAIAVDPAGGKVYVVGVSGAGDFPLVNPGQPITCCLNASFVATIDMNAQGPAISVTPRYSPFLYVRNVSAAPLHLTSFTSTDPTPLAGDCLPAHTLAPGGFCHLVAGGELPYQSEPYFTLTVASDAPGSPHQFQIFEGIPLSQVRDVPNLVTSVSNLYFGYQLVGTSSAAQSFTLTNIGQAPSTIESITANSYTSTPTGINVSHDCPAILSASASCNIQVVFAPTSLISFGGTVSINHDSNQQITIGASGLPVAAAIQASTQSIQFGSQFVGTNYQPRTIVLTNVSSGPIGLTAITASSSYSATNNCPNPLPASATCRVFVSFVPAGNGEVQGNLAVAYNGAGSQVNIQLDGAGMIHSDLSVSPLQIQFPGTVLIGSASNPVPVTLQNTSTSSLTLSSISISPAVFTISSNSCVGPLASAASCTLNVVFTPATPGPVSGTLTIVHSGVGSPQILSASGTGTTQVTLSGYVTFGDQQIGTSSPWHYVDAINLSNSTPVSVTSVAVSGDFQLAQGGPGPIQPGYGTAYQVTFTPSVLGPRTGTLTVVASDSTVPHQITLTGNGVSTGLEVVPTSLAYGTVLAGSSSGSQTVTVSNVSGAVVHFQSISTTGPFSQTNTCGATLASAANCSVSIIFDPTILGQGLGQLLIQDDASGSPHTVTLSGTAIGPALRLSTANLIFGDQIVGSTSAANAISLTNQMSTALAIAGITASGDFAQVNTCGVSLGSGSTCTISATFAPTALGLRSGTLSISDAGPGSPQTVSLSGVGIAPVVSFSPTSVNFGNVFVNQSGTKALNANVTIAPLTIQGIDFSSPVFQQQNSCSTPIAAGFSCTFSLSFQPTAPGNFSGTMTVHDNATNSPQTLQLSGSGTNYMLQVTEGPGQIITAGQAANFMVGFNSVAGTSETASLSCSGAPPKATCSLSQNSLSMTGNPQSVTITVQTTAHGSTSFTSNPQNLGRFLGGSIGMCLLVSVLIAAARSGGFSPRRRNVLALVIFLCFALGLWSCGGGSASTSTGPPLPLTGTPAGVYTLTVTGTSSNAANPPQSVLMTFTVN